MIWGMFAKAIPQTCPNVSFAMQTGVLGRDLVR